MSQDEKNRVLDILNILRRSDGEDGLKRFAGGDTITQARQHGLSFAAVAGLHQFARCRAWSLYYRRTGQRKAARREAALAGAQVRYLRSL